MGRGWIAGASVAPSWPCSRQAGPPGPGAPLPRVKEQLLHPLAMPHTRHLTLDKNDEGPPGISPPPTAPSPPISQPAAQQLQWGWTCCSSGHCLTTSLPSQVRGLEGAPLGLAVGQQLLPADVGLGSQVLEFGLVHGLGALQTWVLIWQSNCL